MNQGFVLSWRVAVIVAAAFAWGCNQSTPTAPTATSPVTTTAAPAAPPVSVTPAPPTSPAPVSPAGAIASLTVSPSPILGGKSATGTIGLAAAAPAGGRVVTLVSSDRDVRMPVSITIAAGTTGAMFAIETSEPHADTPVRITATTDDVATTVDVTLQLPAPGARTDEYTMSPGGTLTVTTPGILDNDTRRSGHDLTAHLRLGPLNGTLALRDDGGFTYRPNAGFSGSDRFIYFPMDGATRGNDQHVWITVGTSSAVASGSQTFSFTGGTQTFTVPAGVMQIALEAYGAQGGTGLPSGAFAGGAGGLGGSVLATLSVVPGAIYQINVGGQGSNGALGVGGGAGGGGASDVRTGAGAPGDRIIVAGGGGGGGQGNGVVPPTSAGGAGGSGGNLVAGTGGSTPSGAGGGGGGTQGSGGAGGGGGAAGGAGAIVQGGTGGGALPANVAGGFNGGANGRSGGGGGGGFYGGGGGGLANTGAGGGGGSSFAIGTAINVTHQQGVRSGNGQIVIRW